MDLAVWLKGWWPVIWALVLTAVSIAQMFLTKTYAKKEDLQMLSEKVNNLETKVDAMPTQQQVTDLLVELANTRGEMKELRAQIQPVQHLSQLLLEQRLKDDK